MDGSYPDRDPCEAFRHEGRSCVGGQSPKETGAKLRWAVGRNDGKTPASSSVAGAFPSLHPTA